MNRLEDWAPLKPFLSVIIIVGTLFVLVILQMEERRMGYELLKLTRDHKRLLEDRRDHEMRLAKLTRPQQVEKAASRMTLRKVQASQVIHLSGTQTRFGPDQERGEFN